MGDLHRQTAAVAAVLLVSVIRVLGVAIGGQGAPAQTPGVMLMNRIGPSASELYVARADGTGAERLTDSPAVDDQGALSPDGTQLAFVSTRELRTTNVWLLDLRTRKLRNLTEQAGLQGDPAKPNGFFRPAWSPDGKWIAFSSDRNTEWRGHSSGDMRSPAWSPDGKSVVYERVGFKPRPQNLKLYSWDLKFGYRYTDVFPSFTKDGKHLITRKDGNSSLDIMDPDGSNRQEVFPASGGAAFSPHRTFQPYGQIFIMKADGSDKRQPTNSLWEDAMPRFVPKAKAVKGS